MTKFNFNKRISYLILLLAYETKKLLTCHSIQQYLLYDYYQAKNEEYQKREDVLKNQKLLRKERKRIQDTINYLTRVGFISLNETQGVKLTDKGILKYLLLRSKGYQKVRQKSNSYYLIIFDIPERYKRLRNLFRQVLYNFEAKMVQKSVFSLADEKAYIYLEKLVQVCKIKDYVKFFKCVNK